MASKKRKSVPNDSGAQSSSQQQKPALEALPFSEWAFHKLRRKSELPYCALWELARLQGVKQKPWLELPEDAKAEFISAEHWGLLEIPDKVGYIDGDPASTTKAITFLVDFGESINNLLEAFRRWLRSSPHRKGRQKRRQKISKLPQKKWRSLLARIVILRATEARMTRAAAIKHTSDLWAAWTTKGVEAGLTSAPHWSRALSEAKALRKEEPRVSFSYVNGYLLRWAISNAVKDATNVG